MAQFEDIVSRGLQSLIDEDPNLALVAADVAHDQLYVDAGRPAPDVAILNFGSLSSPAELRDLHAASPTPAWSCWPTTRRRPSAGR